MSMSRPGTFTAWVETNRERLHGLTYREIRARWPGRINSVTVGMIARKFGVRVKLERRGPPKKVVQESGASGTE